MTSDSQMMRRVLNLMESATCEPTLIEGWLDNIKNKISGKKPNARDDGTKEREELKDQLVKEWETWLGRTHRQGSLNDMLRFMTHRIGFTDENIDAVIGRSGVLPKSEIKKAEKNAEKGPDDKSTQKPPLKPKDQMKQPGYDPEEGIPMPKDLNAKLSDYGEVKGESIEEAANESAIEDQVLSPDMAEKILDLSAAIINDEYLYNGPENDKNHAIAQAAQMGLNQNSSMSSQSRRKAQLPPNVGRAMGRGQYDSNEANQILSALGITDSDVKRLTTKTKAITSISDLNQKDREILIGVAIALLRARS